MVGSEGMAGMPFILGMGVSGVRAIVQGRGSALRMASEPFRVEFHRNSALQDALFRYTYALMAQISQTAACNRFHDGEARLARWLLMTRDRVDADEFLLTQEFLAHMLGLRRVGVTLAATSLKKRELIDYSRGKIHILDVKGLKAASCACYEIVRAVFARAQKSPEALALALTTSVHDVVDGDLVGASASYAQSSPSAVRKTAQRLARQ